jgi:hypothetical protein
MKDSLVKTPAELETALSEAGVPIDIRKLIRSHASAPQTPAAAMALEALIARKGVRPGTIKVTSARLQNWVVNWKTLLFDAVPSIAGGAVSTSKLGMIAGLLKGLKALVESALVELGEREARVVEILWSQDSPIVAKMATQAQSGLAPDQFEPALDALLGLGIIDIEDDTRIIKTEWLVFV